jgi:hypothetical protein
MSVTVKEMIDQGLAMVETDGNTPDRGRAGLSRPETQNSVSSRR